jgi:thiol-disulfide isomerase/thioredoxin
MKALFILVALAIGSINFAQKTATVSGKIKNPTGEKIYLRSYDKSERQWKLIEHDSCVLKDGNFRMTVDLDSLTNLNFWDQNEIGQIYLKPGENISFTLNTHFFDETLLFTGDGADRNNFMARLAIIQETLASQRSWLYNTFENDPDYDTIPLVEGLNAIDSSLEVYIQSEMNNYPELADELENLISSDKAFSDSFRKRAIKKMEFDKMLKAEKGTSFMDVTGVNLDGKKVKVSDFYGKITVLDFWATWCGPCKAEFPGLHELEEKYDGKVTFVGVASFCKKEDWKIMATDEGFHNSIYIEKDNMTPLSEKYAIQTIPRYMILDEKGKIINLQAERPSTGLEDQLLKLLN